MVKSPLKLPEDKDKLIEIILSDKNEIERLKEEIRLLRKALFGAKSEKFPRDDPAQLPLFDMPENPSEEDEKEEEFAVIAEHHRKKPGRRPLPENLPRVDLVHDISEAEKVCECGCRLSKIGEDVTEKLDIIPAKIRVVRHIRPKYACKKCEGVEDSGPTIRIAPAPAQMIPKGLPTAGLLSYLLVNKFCDALPFYRQEKRLARLGIDISRQSMCNWAMMVAENCSDLLKLLHDEIRGGPLLNIDETRLQVLKEPGRKATQNSYMWVFRGGAKKNPVLIYQYHHTRSGDVAKTFLKGYKGVVQTDGYVGYVFLDSEGGILHVGCWAHARRKFMDVKNAAAKGKKSSADKVLHMIRRLYVLEKMAQEEGITPEQIYKMRQRDAKPILAEIKTWLDNRKGQVPPKSLLGKAVNYCLNQWRPLSNYIEDGHAGIDNNAVENAIRPFVVGRKNWLFSGSPKGARASAGLYSLIETAKANGLEPYSYLRFLFEKLPTTKSGELKKLLPNRLSQKELILPDEPSGV